MCFTSDAIFVYSTTEATVFFIMFRIKIYHLLFKMAKKHWRSRIVSPDRCFKGSKQLIEGKQ